MKIIPFVYSFLTSVCVIAYLLVSDSACYWLDTMFYISPFTIFIMFLLSYSLKLCRWHRLECSLPLVPSLVGVMDAYIDLGENTVFISCVTVAVIVILSIINGIKIFLR